MRLGALSTPEELLSQKTFFMQRAAGGAFRGWDCMQSSQGLNTATQRSILATPGSTGQRLQATVWPPLRGLYVLGLRGLEFKHAILCSSTQLPF